MGMLGTLKQLSGLKNKKKRQWKEGDITSVRYVTFRWTLKSANITISLQLMKICRRDEVQDRKQPPGTKLTNTAP
jgi:hypothetical protein